MQIPNDAIQVEERKVFLNRGLIVKCSLDVVEKVFVTEEDLSRTTRIKIAPSS